MKSTKVSGVKFDAAQLSLVVAISGIGVSTGRMLPEIAAALIGAGLLSVLLLPLIGLSLRPRLDMESTVTGASLTTSVASPSAADAA